MDPFDELERVHGGAGHHVFGGDVLSAMEKEAERIHRTIQSTLSQ